MLKPLIRTLNGWRFELPLALVLGASAAFATIAAPIPRSLILMFPKAEARGLENMAQVMIAAVVALIAAFAGYRAMKYPWAVSLPDTVDGDEDADGDPELPRVDIAVRLRRSDAHPDFPPRAPIRASRDLGEPFMDVVGFDDRPNYGGASPAAIPDGDYVELPESDISETAPPAVDDVAAVEPAAPAAGPASRAGDTAAAPPVAPDRPPPPVEPVVAVTDTRQTPTSEPDERPEDLLSIAAFAPDTLDQPAPKPERARRESLTEMMERLSAGLERRAGKPVTPPPAAIVADILAHPRAARPALRDALAELNRLAGRR